MTLGTHADDADLELIEQWKRGDSRSATMLVERHSDALARFAASQGERMEIEELVQDVFVRAFSSINSFRGESSFRTWLFTIERRLMMDRRRSERRQKATVEVRPEDAVTEFDALDTMLAEEAEGRVKQAVDALSPTQREVFILRVEQGMSYREIASVVETTEGAARVHYHHAMRAVKESIRD
ncbi:MAG: RNA polymerase sigma factor [Gemmatimonadaceae bacterium]